MNSTICMSTQVQDDIIAWHIAPDIGWKCMLWNSHSTTLQMCSIVWTSGHYGSNLTNRLFPAGIRWYMVSNNTKVDLDCDINNSELLLSSRMYAEKIFPTSLHHHQLSKALKQGRKDTWIHAVNVKAWTGNFSTVLLSNCNCGLD